MSSLATLKVSVRNLIASSQIAKLILLACFRQTHTIEEANLSKIIVEKTLCTLLL